MDDYQQAVHSADLKTTVGLLNVLGHIALKITVTAMTPLSPSKITVENRVYFYIRLDFVFDLSVELRVRYAEIIDQESLKWLCCSLITIINLQFCQSTNTVIITTSTFAMPCNDRSSEQQWLST